MPDDIKNTDKTAVIPSDDEKIGDIDLGPIEDEDKADKEIKIPKSRLDEESAKRKQDRAEFEAKIADLNSKIEMLSSTQPTREVLDTETEMALNKLTPLLKQKGFLTKEEQEEEYRARKYAEEMKQLSTELNGDDGRPVFDPVAVANWGKSHNVFDLRIAYEQMNKTELRDWEDKQDRKHKAIDTEKPGSSGLREEGNSSILTREALAKRLAEPDGKQWYEKNRDKLMKALANGEIQ